MIHEMVKVISRSKKRTRTTIWNTSQPKPLDDDFFWILEKNLLQFQIRYTGMDQKKSTIFYFKPTNDSTLKAILPHQKEIEIIPLDPILPAYLSRSHESSHTHLLAFSGIGRSLISNRLFESAYIGYAKNTPVFTLKGSSEGFHIRPLLPEVYLKLKGQQPINGKVPGLETESWKLSKKELMECTIFHSGAWWRFNSSSYTMSRSIPDLGNQNSSELRLHKFLLFGVSVTFIALFMIFLQNPYKPREIPMPTEESVVKFVMPRSQVIPISTPVQLPIRKAEIKKSPAAVQKSKGADFKSLFGSALSLTKKENFRPPATRSKKDLFKIKTSPGVQTSSSIESSYSKSMEIKKGDQKPASFIALNSEGSTIEEGLSLEEVGAVIHEHKDEIRYCHEASLLNNSTSGGKIVIQFTIGPSGKVITSQVQSSTATDHELENCILSHLSHWQFPKPKNGVKVNTTYPISLKVIKNE